MIYRTTLRKKGKSYNGISPEEVTYKIDNEEKAHEFLKGYMEARNRSLDDYNTSTKIVSWSE